MTTWNWISRNIALYRPGNGKLIAIYGKNPTENRLVYQGLELEINLRSIWKNHVTKIINGVAGKYFLLNLNFLWFVFTSPDLVSFFLLYVTNWMSYDVFNLEFLWNQQLFVWFWFKKKGYREVCKNDWHNFVWKKKNLISNLLLLLKMLKSKLLQVSFRLNLKVVAQVIKKTQ